jgi:short-subunit dehydrogenase
MTLPRKAFMPRLVSRTHNLVLHRQNINFGATLERLALTGIWVQKQYNPNFYRINSVVAQLKNWISVRKSQSRRFFIYQMIQKTILITGCSTGIGYATATYLKKKGYRVFATCRKQKDVKRLQKQGFESFLLDVSSTKSIKKAVAEVKKRTNSLYALFNNAGFVIPGAVEDLSKDTLKIQFETNIFGALELTNSIMPIFRKQKKGRIIFNSSVLGFISIPYRSAYCASKYAMEAFVDGLRMEVPKGIHITLIEPGPIKTKIEENALENFHRYINKKKSFYSDIYQALLIKISERKDVTFFRLSAQKVAEKVYKILQSPRPKPRYYITIPTYVLGFLKRILSSKMTDRLISIFN